MKLVVKALYIITEMLLGEDGDVFIVSQCPIHQLSLSSFDGFLLDKDDRKV